MWPTPQAEQDFPTGPPGRKGVVGARVRGTVLRQVHELGVFAGKAFIRSAPGGAEVGVKGVYACVRVSTCVHNTH